MVAVSKRYCARAITGNRCAVVEAVSSSVDLGGRGIIKKIIVKAAKFTASAKAKIETAGGKAEVVK